MRYVIPNIVLPVLLLGCGQATEAQTETVLYSFAGSPDGADPHAGLVRYQGNFYGTTMQGGSSNLGTVFKLTPKGKETILHSFAGGTDGDSPTYGLVFDKEGNLHGTTPQGGAFNSGTVFTITPSGTESVVYTFTGGADGANPSSGLILDGNGNLYGTTFGGGAYGNGTVFALSPSGVETVIYSFTGGADGGGPAGGLVRDGKGDLFGTNSGGYGIVFKVTPSGSETVLHYFTGDVSDGSSPSSGLVRDTLGNLYGTTSEGGTGDDGTLYEVSKSGVETILIDFSISVAGYTPVGNLLLDKYDNLYGTTFNASYPPCYCGAVFQFGRSVGYFLLYDFGRLPDGAYPNRYLVFGASGHLYGTTRSGGAYNQGTVFEVTP